MNKIIAIMDKSDYEIYNDFLNFKIDDYFLDEKLDELYPNNMYKGLIPTLLGLNFTKENKLVWQRILPQKGNQEICPILMCPDDCDFSCTIIVAKIKNNGKKIIWESIGLGKIQEYKDAEKIASNVEWFTKISNLTFDIQNYTKMVEDFKKVTDGII